MLVLLLCAICGTGVGIVHLTKAPNESLLSATTGAITSTAGNISEQLGLEDMVAKLKESVPIPKGATPVTPEDPQQAAATTALFEKMFLHQGDSYFTQSQWGAKPVPYELRDFELVGPNQQSLTEADRMNGVDRRVSYAIHVSAYRVFDTDKGWGTWLLKNPPQLDGLTMVRQAGSWKIVSDPSRLYALK